MTASHRYLLLGMLVVLVLPAAWWLSRPDPLEEGQALRRMGKPAEALAVWERACNRTPPHIEACAAASVQRMGRGEPELARALFERAKAADPGHLRVMLLEASFLGVDGKVAEAKAVYEEAEKLHPDSGLPAAQLAALALAGDDLSEAERCAERAIAADPSLALGYAMRARVMVATSSLDQAIGFYFDSLERDPTQTSVCMELADVLGQVGDWPRRLALLDGTCLPFDPENPQVLVALALELRDAGSVDQAVDYLRTASDVDPACVSCRVYLCAMFLEQGKPDFAMPRCEEALAIEPGHKDATHFLAMGLDQRGETDRATSLADELLARKDLSDADRVRTLLLRAGIRNRLGKRAEARVDARAAIAIDPESQDGNWLCGSIALELGDQKEAEKCLTDALSADGPPRCDVVRDLSRVYARGERKAETLQYLKVLPKLGCFDPQWVRTSPEFRFLEQDEEFRLLMEGASEPEEEPEEGPDGAPPDFLQ